jgi:hypothetical protein
MPIERYSSDRPYVALLLVICAPIAVLAMVPAVAILLGTSPPPSTGLVIAGVILGGLFAYFSFHLGYRLFRPDSLIVNDSGVTHIALGKTRFWGWAEIERAKTFSTYQMGTPPILLLELAAQRDGLSRRPISLGAYWKAPSERSAADFIAEKINVRLDAIPR